MRRQAAVSAARLYGEGEQLSPIVRAVLDARDEEIVVFDARGDALYQNAAAQAANPAPAPEGYLLRMQLIARGGRAVRLQSGDTALGEVVVVARGPHRTLADREREAIQQTLHHTAGKLAEAARRLGISRTTLWRRRKAQRQ